MKDEEFSIRYDDVFVGQTASLRVCMDEEKVDAYSALIGDTFSFHVSEEAARKTRFGKRIAHGIHLLSYVSFLIGTQLPGFGTIYCAQELTFHNPVYLGETVEISVRITEKLPKNCLRMETLIRSETKPVLSGSAVVKTWR